MSGKRNSIPWTTDERLQRAGGAIGNLSRSLGAEAPETLAAHTEVRTVRAELAIEDLIQSAPAPTAEQIGRLRAMLPAVDTIRSAVAA
ncbi:hypothetical protein KBX71_07735 [Micromonospora sp. D93]|uniref:hypothetical protein n=1 Tax=Micromonospora sp. D93 TaxID=2824886 RepID=UPI001B37AB02|nr:hypothetical protein [Micromonospora sp. D93]MBQ1017760.1 hypothetical protein [Micromonospora sp. D93]